MCIRAFVYFKCLQSFPTYQIVHVCSGEHVCPHVGVLVEEGVEK